MASPKQYRQDQVQSLIAIAGIIATLFGAYGLRIGAGWPAVGFIVFALFCAYLWWAMERSREWLIRHDWFKARRRHLFTSQEVRDFKSDRDFAKRRKMQDNLDQAFARAATRARSFGINNN